MVRLALQLTRNTLPTLKMAIIGRQIVWLMVRLAHGLSTLEMAASQLVIKVLCIMRV